MTKNIEAPYEEKICAHILGTLELGSDKELQEVSLVCTSLKGFLSVITYITMSYLKR